MAQIKGIGGIFFRSSDPEKSKQWYREHLHFDTDEFGVMFKGRDHEDPSKETHLQWSVFPDDTKYFEPAKSEFMINYRVDNLEEVVNNLRAKGVEIIGDIQEFSYGKFAHILDGEGRKVELWEPAENPFS